MGTMNAIEYQFQDFLLDVENRSLTRDGRTVEIQDVPFDLLSTLVRGGGRLIARRDLADAVWGEGTFMDIESGLNTAVRKLRKVLEDNPAAPRFIETVPRHGYRFLAEINELAPESPVDSSGASWRGSKLRGVLAAASIVGLALFVLSRSPGGGETMASEAPVLQCSDERTVRVAVLAFEPGDDSESTRRLGSALTEDVAGALWDVDALRLAARVFPDAGGISPADSDMVLTGAVRREGDEIELVVRLLEPEGMGLVWERRFEAPESEPYMLRSRVAATVASFVAGATHPPSAGPQPLAS